LPRAQRRRPRRRPTADARTAQGFARAPGRTPRGSRVRRGSAAGPRGGETDSEERLEGGEMSSQEQFQRDKSAGREDAPVAPPEAVQGQINTQNGDTI